MVFIPLVWGPPIHQREDSLTPDLRSAVRINRSRPVSFLGWNTATLSGLFLSIAVCRGLHVLDNMNTKIVKKHLVGSWLL